MNIFEKEAILDRTVCPYLVEWTGWTELFCRLRYKKPDILNASEIEDYCRGENHNKCLFFMNQFNKHGSAS